MRSLMDGQRIEQQEGCDGWWCALCGGQHDDRHCVQDIVEGVSRAPAAAQRYPARLIRPGVSGGDLAQQKRPVNPTVGPVCVGSRLQSVSSSFIYTVTRIRRGSIIIRRGAHVASTSLSLLLNPAKWRRVG